MLYSGGIVRSMLSGASFAAPSPASASAPSFPSLLLCPFTFSMNVHPGRNRSCAQIACKISLFAVSIHPRRSSLRPYLCIPSIAYCESVLTCKLASFWMVCAATNIAISSPVLFDCSMVGGRRIALFCSSSLPCHTPAPARACWLPLSMHEPSVYIMMVSTFSICFQCVLIGIGCVLSPSPNILKPSARL